MQPEYRDRVLKLAEDYGMPPMGRFDPVSQELAGVGQRTANPGVTAIKNSAAAKGQVDVSKAVEPHPLPPIEDVPEAPAQSKGSGSNLPRLGRIKPEPEPELQSDNLTEEWLNDWLTQSSGARSTMLIQSLSPEMDGDPIAYILGGIDSLSTTIENIRSEEDLIAVRDACDQVAVIARSLTMVINSWDKRDGSREFRL